MVIFPILDCLSKFREFVIPCKFQMALLTICMPKKLGCSVRTERSLKNCGTSVH